jgi:tetratricopeptide (TPR) repeat protein
MVAEDNPASNIPADTHKAAGLNYFCLEQWQNAIYELSLCLRNDPKDTEVLFCIGSCYGKLGKHKQAAEHYEAITKTDAQSSSAFYSWGVALRLLYMETKDSEYLKQAKEKYESAIKFKPDCPEAFHDLGNVLDLTYVKTNELAYLKQAIEQYKKAIEFRADYPQAHFNLTYALTLLFSAERDSAVLDDALVHAKKALECRPERKDYCYNLACVYSLKEMRSEMLEALEQAICFDSKHKMMAREDEDFTKYHKDPIFIALTKGDEKDTAEGI